MSNKPNHEEAYLLAEMKSEESNLARSYLDLLNLLVDVTHHEGALKEFEPRWLPIVQAELSRRMNVMPNRYVRGGALLRRRSRMQGWATI